jgi:hypothetical protein
MSFSTYFYIISVHTEILIVIGITLSCSSRAALLDKKQNHLRKDWLRSWVQIPPGPLLLFW